MFKRWNAVVCGEILPVWFFLMGEKSKGDSASFGGYNKFGWYSKDGPLICLALVGKRKGLRLEGLLV